MAFLTEARLFAASTPDVQPGMVPTVRARVACPETGGIDRVRLAMDPVSGRPTVVWCARFDGHPITCERRCLEVVDIADPA